MLSLFPSFNVLLFPPHCSHSPLTSFYLFRLLHLLPPPPSFFDYQYPPFHPSPSFSFSDQLSHRCAVYWIHNPGLFLFSLRAHKKEISWWAPQQMGKWNPQEIWTNGELESARNFPADIPFLSFLLFRDSISIFPLLNGRKRSESISASARRGVVHGRRLEDSSRARGEAKDRRQDVRNMNLDLFSHSLLVWFLAVFWCFVWRIGFGVSVDRSCFDLVIDGEISAKFSERSPNFKQHLKRYDAKECDSHSPVQHI